MMEPTITQDGSLYFVQHKTFRPSRLLFRRLWKSAGKRIAAVRQPEPLLPISDLLRLSRLQKSQR